VFEKIATLLQDIVGGPHAPDSDIDEVRIAAVALCNQVMAADGRITPEERAVVADVLKQRFGLEGRSLAALLEAGERAEKNAVDFFRFTSVLKRGLNEEQRTSFIGLLWDIVYADGEKSEVEDHVIWRIADLLGVETRDRVEQRMEAEKRARVRQSS
jgi:uncharacterized tellurite resistance protein B-like protein